MAELIRFFTKANEWVLDYFMGVGGTLLGASLEDRNALGIDLNEKYIEAYGKACEELDLKKQHTMIGDSIELLEQGKVAREMGRKNFSLICIDPPYGDMMSRDKTGERRKNKTMGATPFTDSEHDLGNLDEDAFFERLKKTLLLALPMLKAKGHVVIFTKDFQPSGKNTNLLHADIINKMNEIENLNYLGMKIWADESINLYPYGYPYSFVANQLHQYILIFRKEK